MYSFSFEPSLRQTDYFFNSPSLIILLLLFKPSFKPLILSNPSSLGLPFTLHSESLL